MYHRLSGSRRDAVPLLATRRRKAALITVIFLLF